MPHVSLSMIVKDEAETLPRILGDARSFCDEMIIVDTGSSDGTSEIAVEAGAKVIHTPWTDDFSEARNISLEACTGDWIVWLDADDRIPVSSQQEFSRIIAGLGDDVDVVATPYHLRFNEDGGCMESSVRERMLRRAANLRWSGTIHESVDMRGIPSARVRAEPTLIVEHRPPAAKAYRDPGRNLRIIEKAYTAGDRSIRLLYHRASEFQVKGWHGEAIAAYREALEALETERSACSCPAGITACSPSFLSYFSLFSLAQSLIALDRNGEAVEVALKAIHITPVRPEAWMAAGVAHFNQKNYELASPFFSAATQARKRPPLGPLHDIDYSWAPWDYLSSCLGAIGRYEEALSAGNRALSGNPDKGRVQKNLDDWAAALRQ
ncbi:glycosyltransferase [Streptomyces sp. NPDC006283]|uniref:glycosyltransferase n=1 Tax=Streptomyces sp. NPDC006283 TaxID=3156741 RepID=UPI0033AD2F7E